MQPRIYLDNAATSWPKPEAVYRAVEHYQRNVGASAGRSVYAEAVEASQGVDAARQAVARVLGVRDARHIIFTANGTEALNLAIRGVLRQGEHVVTSDVEHNSVLRPLRELQDAGVIEVTRVPCDAEGVVAAEAIIDAVRPNTSLIVLSHASNVTGAIQPVEAVGAAASQRGILLLVDAAQALGHLPIDVPSLHCDLLAAPGHKGLLGPLGTGVLYIRPGVEERLRSLRQGGTGSQSDDDHQPSLLPDKYESGNHNVPGILGLGAGVRYLQERGFEEIRRHELELTAQLLEGLSQVPGVTLFGPGDPAQRVGVVSFTLEGIDPQEAASLLDAVHHVQARSGIHCAPRMHQSLGTASTGGTIRFSTGLFTTASEIAAAIEAVAQIATVSTLSNV
jgi:cysteine desulfurase family protein